MAKVSGPFYSLDASGTLGKAITACKWKGINYVRKWFIPENPKTEKQVNQRLALTIALAYFKALTAPDKVLWEEAAAGMGMSGINLYMKKALDAYTVQLGTSKVPASVSYTGTIPDVVFTWVEAV